MTTIIIDADGPLLDGKKKRRACYRFIAERLGFAPLDEKTYWKKKRERTPTREVLALSGAEAQIENFKKSWLEHIESPVFLALDSLQKSAPGQIKAWSNAGFHLVVSSMRQNFDKLEKQFEAFGLSSYLPSVSVTDFKLGGEGKAQAILGKTSLSPANSLWIGDTEVDIEAARRVGCPIWALTCGLRSGNFLSGLKPDFLVENIGEVVPENSWSAK